MTWNNPMRPTMSQDLKVHAGNKLAEGLGLDGGKQHGDLVDVAAKTAAVLNGILYQLAAAGLDVGHLLQNSREIDVGIREGEGVLMARLTIRRPDGGGNAHYEYAGVQVVGFGRTAAQALETEGGDPQNCIQMGQRAFCAPRRAETVPSAFGAVCTPDNSTGEPRRTGPTVSATPRGATRDIRRTLPRRLARSYSATRATSRAASCFTARRWSAN